MMRRTIFTSILSSLVILLSPQVSVAKALPCPPTQTQYDHIILDAARKQGVDAALIHAVIKQESCYYRLAVSPAGAEGLMQLMPATARRFNVKNAFAAKQNINAGAKYLAWLLKRFNGNIRFALAAYNAGEGKVDRYQGIPPYKETIHYVKIVMANYRRFKGLPTFKAKLPVSKPLTLLAKKTTPKPNHVITAKPRSVTRIRSITLAKLITRDGYTRIRAIKRQEG